MEWAKRVTIYIGFDESGLGPMLGPLVVASSGFRLDNFKNDEDFAEKIKKVVSWKKKQKGKLFVGDSKKVYTRSKGIKDLETSALAFLFLKSEPKSFKEMLELHSPGIVKEMELLPWYTDDFDLPIERELDYIKFQRDMLAKALSTAGIEFDGYGLNVKTVRTFNSAIDRLDNKSLVNFEGFSDIFKVHFKRADEQFLCAMDRQGGRESYKDILEPMVGKDKKIMAREVGEERSLYEVRGGRSETFISFEVNGDSKRFTIGLASIFAKYVREGCMHLFNLYWQNHMPDLKATAGYTTDARRFLKEIDPLPEELDIKKDDLIRKR